MLYEILYHYYLVRVIPIPDAYLVSTVLTFPKIFADIVRLGRMKEIDFVLSG